MGRNLAYEPDLHKEQIPGLSAKWYDRFRCRVITQRNLTGCRRRGREEGTVGTHLKADLTKISQVSRSMTGIADEFANITHVADVSGSAGDPSLESALSDFATGWSDKRTQLIEQLRELATMAGTAVREYTSTDDTLASKLAGADRKRP